MRLPLLLLILAVMSTLSAPAQPSITSMVNAASYASAPLDANGNPIGNNTIAEGAFFVIFGSGLGPSSLVTASLPLPTRLPDANGTSVSISSGGQNVSAFLFYTSASQVAGILPSNVPVGDASVTLTYNGQTSAPVKVTVAKSGFGVFTLNQGGSGQAIAEVFTSSTDFTFNGLTKPAHPGDTIVIVGTGLGPISGPDNVAPGAVATSSTVTVTIGGKVIQPSYAGRAPQFPGEDQINLQLPADVPLGCYTPAVVSVNNQPSNSLVLSTAAPGATFCVHPLGLGQDALARLDAGGTANIGVFQFLRAVLFGIQAEGAGGIFVKANADQVYKTYLRIPVAFGTISYPAPVNACAVFDDVLPGGFSIPNFKREIGGTELSPGAALNITGPGPNGSQTILRATDSTTNAESGGYLGVFLVPGGVYTAGAWTLSGTGGPDVGAFSAKLTLPDNFAWTNSGAFTSSAGAPRSDLTIVFSGGTSGANPVVYVFGNSSVVNANDPSKNRGKTFVCAAPASAGKFIVPASITSQLPPSTAAAGETAVGTLGLTTGGSANFTAPLTSGALDTGYIAYGEAQTVNVKWNP